MKDYRKILISMCIALLMTCYTHSLYADSDDHIIDMKIDDTTTTITVVMDDAFGNQEFTEKYIKKLYKKTKKGIRKELPKKYRDYNIRIMTQGMAVEALLSDNSEKEEQHKPERHRKKHSGWWEEAQYDGMPWVRNVSSPHTVTSGLQGKHLSIWASHGRFYDAAKATWRWQRPNIFCTNEDLFTQTIVVPYLIPMLEKAGAVVFTPRERDWQTEEVIVDNDNPVCYQETGRWSTASVAGFAMPYGNIQDNFNPFEKGTVRQATATRNANGPMAIYQPKFQKGGRYAVYVSYATLENSVDDVTYRVYHQGQHTDFKVNQQMGGGTWVYLGHFNFDQGSSEFNRVVILSQSADKGVITTDAVRFGGGMGNIERGGTTSGLPRCLEGSRYYAQWAGAPYTHYSVYQGQDDYKDDINARSLMTNWLAGGSPYAPTKEGKKVPLCLSLAIHSDAGYNPDLKSIYGSLGICTTDFNDGKLDAGVSRSHSKDFAQSLLNQATKDIIQAYGKWEWRDLYDRNYSESRLPAMPSAIFETLSHQSFPDMKMALDPNFRFTLARSIYKTILRYEAEAHGEKAVVSPLSPTRFAIRLEDNGTATLTWSEQKDKTESSATPASYNVYTAMGGYDYDNGINTRGNSFSVRLQPDLMYRFRITAVNAGGESFPSEELCVVWHSPHAPNVLIVNGFNRLSSPEVRDNPNDKGFDMAADPGVSYGMTAGWAGEQQVFSTATAGREGPGTFGYCGNELAGKFVAGNDFNYVSEHAIAMLSAYRYNIVSASRSAVEQGEVNLKRYDCVDLILGNEKNDGYSLLKYKTFTRTLQEKLLDYQEKGRGALLVSGSYIGTDMQEPGEKAFLASLLHCTHDGFVTSSNGIVNGLQQTIIVTNALNPDHYATTRSDILRPVGKAFMAMNYQNNMPAAIALNDYRFKTFTMGFPFECITSHTQQALIMRGIMQFLLP